MGQTLLFQQRTAAADLSPAARALVVKIARLDRLRPRALEALHGIADQLLCRQAKATISAAEQLRFRRDRAASADHNRTIGAHRCAEWLEAHPQMAVNA